MFDVKKLYEESRAKKQRILDDAEAERKIAVQNIYTQRLNTALELKNKLVNILNTEQYPNPDFIECTIPDVEYVLKWCTPPGAVLTEIVELIRDIQDLLRIPLCDRSEYYRLGLDPDAIRGVFDDINGYSVSAKYVPSKGPWEQATDAVASLCFKRIKVKE